MIDDTRRDDDAAYYGEESTHRRRRHEEPSYRDNDRAAAAVKRVSWGAIFAGTVVAVVVQIMLNLLGIGLGMSALDPTEADPLSGLGLGTILWLVVTTLIALFAGGWVAGRLAGIPRRFDGAIHGFLAWGLATLLAFYLITSTVGALVGGVFGLAGQGLQAAGQGVAAVAPEAREVLQEQGVTLERIKREATQLLEQSGLEEEVERAAETAQDEAGDAVRTPGSAEQDIGQAVEQLLRTGRAADRENLINIMVARTDMSRQEAQRTVEQYESQYEQVRQRASRAVDSLQQTARTAGGEATEAFSTVGYAGFFALLVGALSAIGGGVVGAPKDLPAVAARERDTRVED